VHGKNIGEVVEFAVTEAALYAARPDVVVIFGDDHQ
jgi:hypothetical protein